MMKLKTSYFNASVLRKNLSRFAPVWVLYALGLFLIMSAFYTSQPDHMASSLAETMGGLSFVNWAYAFLCATMLFGDLFQSRMCNALHAMPMRRCGWFLTHIASGFLFALIPNVLLAAVAGILLQEYVWLAFWWLLSTMGQFLFHFALASLCAMCVGNRFAHGMVYGFASFLSLIAYWFASIFYEPLLYGIVLDQQQFMYLCPTAWLGQGNFFLWDYLNGVRYVESFNIEVWIYLAVCAGTGILMLLLAMLVYRRRKLETAGDFISFKALSPVFLLLYTLIAGTVFYTFGELFTDNGRYVFLFIGLITGFFTGRMLLERSLKVFRWKSIAACLMVVILFSGSLTLAYLDPAGITRWIPEKNDVNSASISVTNSASLTQPLTEPDDIEAVMSIHRKLLLEGSRSKYGNQVELSYTLKDGRTVKRSYQLEILSSKTVAELTPILSRWEVVMRGAPLENLADNTLHIYANSTDNFPSEAYGELLEAIAQDCTDGNMSQSYALHANEGQKFWLEIHYIEENGASKFLYLDVFECCTNTIAVLEQYASAEYAEKFPG